MRQQQRTKVAKMPVRHSSTEEPIFIADQIQTKGMHQPIHTMQRMRLEVVIGSPTRHPHIQEHTEKSTRTTSTIPPTKRHGSKVYKSNTRATPPEAASHPGTRSHPGTPPGVANMVSRWPPKCLWTILADVPGSRVRNRRISRGRV